MQTGSPTISRRVRRAPPGAPPSRAFARKGEGGAGEDGPGGGAQKGTDVQSGTGQGDGRAIVCLVCGHKLTRANAAIPVAGSHTHAFMNPGGFVFEIACYRDAPGTVGVGPPSAEWSWFPGHVWRVALCGGCRCHVGWSFRSESAVFFGLVQDRVGEADE